MIYIYHYYNELYALNTLSCNAHDETENICNSWELLKSLTLNLHALNVHDEVKSEIIIKKNTNQILTVRLLLLFIGF